MKRTLDSDEVRSAKRQPKAVLFWLPPSPPPEMNDPRRSERLKAHTAQPTDTVPRQERSLHTGASDWAAHELELLKVYFEELRPQEYLDVLSQDPEWNANERQSISQPSPRTNY